MADRVLNIRAIMYNSGSLEGISVETTHRNVKCQTQLLNFKEMLHEMVTLFGM